MHNILHMQIYKLYYIHIHTRIQCLIGQHRGGGWRVAVHNVYLSVYVHAVARAQRRDEDVQSGLVAQVQVTRHTGLRQVLPGRSGHRIMTAHIGDGQGGLQVGPGVADHVKDLPAVLHVPQTIHPHPGVVGPGVDRPGGSGGGQGEQLQGQQVVHHQGHFTQLRGLGHLCQSTGD